MRSLSHTSLLRSTVQGQTGQTLTLGSNLNGLTFNITSASVSDSGILTFSWTPILDPVIGYPNFDFAIHSGFTNGTGFSSTYPGANIYSDEMSYAFDEPRKGIQNIYNWIPQNAINKWKSSAAPGNPYDSRVPQTIIAGQGSEGCSGFNAAYSNLRSYNGMVQYYPQYSSSNSATIDLKLIQSDPYRSSNPSWKFASKLVRGNARIMIRPWIEGGPKSSFGSAYYTYGNWSFYDVTLPSNDIFPILKTGGQNTNYRLEGRTVKWDLDSCLTNFYMYLYKNGSVLRNGYLGNDGNAGAYNGSGDLAYTIPDSDGSGSYQLYISNYYLPTNTFGAYTSFSFSL